MAEKRTSAKTKKQNTASTDTKKTSTKQKKTASTSTVKKPATRPAAKSGVAAKKTPAKKTPLKKNTAPAQPGSKKSATPSTVKPAKTTAKKSSGKLTGKTTVKQPTRVEKKPAVHTASKAYKKSPGRPAAQQAKPSSSDAATSAKVNDEGIDLSLADNTARKLRSSSATALKKILEKQPLPFEIGTYIFYPNEGLGYITKLEEREFNKERTLYYVISFPSQKMISRVPVKNTKVLKMRRVISKASAQKVLKMLSTFEERPDVSWKDRLSMYQEILKKGNTVEMAEIVATLSMRRRVKPLSFQERQYYEFAVEALTGELSVAMEIERTQAEEKIKASLETLAHSKKNK